MKKKIIFAVVLSLSTMSMWAQKGLYVKPEIASVWNSHEENSYEYRALENGSLMALIFGYQFDNKWTIESGIQYQNAEIGHTWMFNRNDVSSTKVLSSDKAVAYLNIPLNLKYNINTEIEHFKLVPYVGLTLVNNLTEQGVYETEYITNMANDTLAIIESEGISKKSLLFNAGLALEYEFKHFSVSMSGNFTGGFTNLNKSTLHLTSSIDPNDGQLFYKGNKFFFAFGVKVPIG